MSCLQRLSSALLVVGLCGCASVPNPQTLARQKPGMSEAEMLSLAGPPQRRVVHADGTFSLIYSTQPTGTKCFKALFDQSKQLIEVEDTLSTSARELIQPGMSRAALMERMCDPVSRLQTAAPYEILNWNMEPFTASEPRFFEVYLQNSRVHHTLVRTVYFTGY